MVSQKIILTGKQTVELQELTAAPAAPGEVLARTEVSLISTGTEMICYRGELEPGTHWAGWVRYPFNLGYSNVGRVVEVGSGVDGVAVGDRVFSTSPHHGLVRLRPPLLQIPDGVSNESAAWAKLASIAQTGVRRAEPEMGATAVVIGAGPIGQLVTQYLAAIGASRIIIVDTVPSRLQLALDHGATDSFTGTAAAAGDAVRDLTEGRLADCVFDATGHWAVFPQALALARRFGTVVLIGDCPTPSKQILTADVVTRQLRILGTHNESLAPAATTWDEIRQRQLFFSYLERGRMRVEDLITHRHAPVEAAAVYAGLLANRGDTLGVIFDWRV